MQATEFAARDDNDVLVAISNEIVRIYKDQFGRGPSRARTYWCNADVITVVLENTLTPTERTLVDLGEHPRLRELRMFFQYSSVSAFCEPVERLTGRTVRSFVSGIDSKVDGLSIETFVLHPEDYAGPSRTAFADD